MNVGIDARKGVRPDDIIIAFMGPTGSGKSFFIDLLTQRKDKRANDALKPSTNGIEFVRMPHPTLPGRHIVFLDTPSFDGDERTDTEILKSIGNWLQKKYGDHTKLSGLLYLHRISDNRMAGSPYRNLRLFGELCGDSVSETMSQIVLVSTDWKLVDETVGLAREEELKATFWSSLIKKGSRVDSLKTATPREAWRIVDELVSRCLQKEATGSMRGMKHDETQSAKVPRAKVQRELAEQEELMKSLFDRVEKSNDPHQIKVFKQEFTKFERRMDRELQQKRSFLGKLKSFISRR